jgi:hypothetical protein
VIDDLEGPGAAEMAQFIVNWLKRVNNQREFFVLWSLETGIRRPAI